MNYHSDNNENSRPTAIIFSKKKEKKDKKE